MNTTFQCTGADLMRAAEESGARLTQECRLWLAVMGECVRESMLGVSILDEEIIVAAELTENAVVLTKVFSVFGGELQEANEDKPAIARVRMDDPKLGALADRFKADAMKQIQREFEEMLAEKHTKAIAESAERAAQQAAERVAQQFEGRFRSIDERFAAMQAEEAAERRVTSPPKKMTTRAKIGVAAAGIGVLSGLGYACRRLFH